MPNTPEGFAGRIDRLKTDVVSQARRVLGAVETAFDAVFSSDPRKAELVVQGDDDIDNVDVAIEKSAVQLLADATRENAALDTRELRVVLMLAKINNELERIADAAVDVCELIRPVAEAGANARSYPDTFRVMANSVIGIVRDTGSAVQRGDPRIAKVVLQSQHAVTAFKAAILRDAETQIASGKMPVDFAFRLHEIASQCELIADHCTNISEQVIYAETGAIVRHMESRWVEIPHPQ
jgi:phosphate transport system protein